jgi:hypothetical protein
VEPGGARGGSGREEEHGAGERGLGLAVEVQGSRVVARISNPGSR